MGGYYKLSSPAVQINGYISIVSRLVLSAKVYIIWQEPNAHNNKKRVKGLLFWLKIFQGWFG